MRGLEGRLTYQFAERLTRRAKGADGGHLHRRIVVQGRQDARQSLGQHGFARSGRAGEEHVMPAGRGDFQGEAALRLAGYVAHVRGNTRAFLGTGLLLGVRGGRVG